MVSPLQCLNTPVPNEVMPSPRSPLITDEDGDMSDWVELYNLSDEDIYLGNLSLSDDPGKPVKWIFPQNAVIPANGYYLVFCSGKDKVEVNTAYPHTNFSINKLVARFNVRFTSSMGIPS